MAGHLLASACLVAAAWWLMLPLTTRLGTHVPGILPGDNVVFVWNTWWFRHAFAAHSMGLWCDLLFAPHGTSLVLHTHGFLQALAAYVLFPSGSIVVAHNVILVAGVVANGLCTYGLAFHYTRRSMPSLIAGVMFTWSTFVAVHLAGHFNLVHAWVLPLELWCLARFLERPSNGRAAMVAVSLTAIAYSDYYFLLYALVATGVLTAARAFVIRLEPRGVGARRAAAALFGLAAFVGALVLAIWWTGGWVVPLESGSLSIRGTRNPVGVATLLCLAALVVTYRVRIARRAETVLPDARRWAILAVTLAALLSPLIVATVRLLADGGYASQPAFWRSSPGGIDLATLVEGPPRHLIFGELVTMLYKGPDINPIEQSGWIGVVGLIGIGLAVLRYRREAEVRAWLVVAAVFFALALGPFVRVAGVDTGIPGPFALLRYVPVFSNARMPGRAIVVVQLAAAVLTAMALSRRTARWNDGLGWLFFLVLETFPYPTPLYPLPVADRVDAALAQSPVPGSVLELPTGLRDGFGVIGGLDHRMLVHQMAHGRPLVGGFVARMSPVLRREYLATPLFTHAFALSSFLAPRNLPIAASDAAAQGVAFLVLDRDALHHLGALERPVLEAAGFRYVMADGDRELYAVGTADRRPTD